MGKLHHFGQGARRPSDPASDSAASVKAPSPQNSMFFDDFALKHGEISARNYWRMIKIKKRQKISAKIWRNLRLHICGQFSVRSPSNVLPAAFRTSPSPAQRWDCGKKNVESSVQVGWGFVGKLGLAWRAAIAWLGASPEKLLELKTRLFSSFFICSIWISKTRFFTSLEPAGQQMWVNRDRSYHYAYSVAYLVSTCPDNDLHWEYSNLQRLHISTYGYNILQHATTCQHVVATTSMSSLASFFPMISPFVIWTSEEHGIFRPWDDPGA